MKKRRIMKKTLLLIVGAAVFMVSCESKTYADIAPPVANPTYDANVKPIVDANCATSGCHSEGATFPPLTNYAEVKDAAQNGQFLCKINATCGGVMPPSGKLDQGTVDIINKWAQQGYVEK